MRSEASFAALCGTSPIEASSGQAKRHRLITDPPPVPRGPDLRQQRTRKGLTITTIATALNTPPTRISELERDLRHNHDLAQRYQQHL